MSLEYLFLPIPVHRGRDLCYIYQYISFVMGPRNNHHTTGVAMKTLRMIPYVILITIFLISTTGMRTLAPSATINVTTFNDEYGTGVTTCSLREAIQTANSDIEFGGCTDVVGTDTIYLPAGSYTLEMGGANDDLNASGDLDITSNLSIIGQGTGAVIQANGIDRALDIQSLATVVLNQLTITGGSLPEVDEGSGDSGGGIRNAGTLTLTHVTVSSNRAGDGDSWVEDRNTGGMGGGIVSSGSLTIIDSLITNNHAGDGYNQTDWGATGGHGGGIAVTAGSLSITNSTITGNVAGESKATQGGWGGNGGGIYTNGSSASITASTISLNIGGKSYRDYGGYGGGIFAATNINLLNSTVSGNKSGAGGSIYGGPGGGCGIYAESATIRYSTIYNNSSATGSDASQSNGGGINAMNLTLGASIVAGNSVWKDIHPNIVVYGNGVSEDYNVIGEINYGWTFTSGPTGNSYLDVADYSLLPLGDNGGPTQTHAMLSDNLAVDKIPGGSLGCGTTYAHDQRGYGRPVNAACEIGAYEFGNTPPVAVPDTYSTVYVTILTVDAAGGLLVNDTDAEADPLTAMLVSGPDPAQGSLTLSADGSFTFTPAAGFAGDATFTYVASDGIDTSAPTLVTIHVTAQFLYLPLIKH
jgi:CSLREA domain-containing protein